MGFYAKHYQENVMAAIGNKLGEFKRVIFHVDMDSFYASCELSLKPELRNEPFVVGADPKQGKGRGVVLACNYAARKFGLRSGMPISTAWQLCPQAHYDRPHFELYEQVSARVMNLLKQFADRVEQVSIDEAYLDVTSKVKEIPNAEPDERKSIHALADLIRNNVFEKEKISCSIGIADSKIVAKIATDMNKPNGVTLVRPSETKQFLAPLDVSKIPGVGKVTQKTLLDKFGVKSITDLRKINIEDLKERFGRNAIWLMNVADGIDESEVVQRWEPISLSGETTFEHDEEDYQKVREAMLEVAKDVHRRAASDGYKFRNVGIKIRFAGFETHTRAKSLSAYTDSIEVLKREVEKLLSEFYESKRKVRLVGVRVSSLQKMQKEQRTLFDWE